MTMRTIYATNGFMTEDGEVDWSKKPNALHGVISIAIGSEGNYSINVGSTAAANPHRPAGYTLLDRDELALIRDAITLELERQ